MAQWIADNRVGPTQYAVLSALMGLPNFTGTLYDVREGMPGKSEAAYLRASARALYNRGLIIHQCRDREHYLGLGCEVTITAHGLESRRKGGAEQYRQACKRAAALAR